MGVEYVSLDELLEVADIVSLHCPLNPSTFHIINEERCVSIDLFYFGRKRDALVRLELMKPSSILINVSRGGLVDTDALIEALEKCRIAGCAMDVYGNEGDLSYSLHRDKV